MFITKIKLGLYRARRPKENANKCKAFDIYIAAIIYRYTRPFYRKGGLTFTNSLKKEKIYKIEVVFGDGLINELSRF